MAVSSLAMPLFIVMRYFDARPSATEQRQALIYWGGSALQCGSLPWRVSTAPRSRTLAFSGGEVEAMRRGKYVARSGLAFGCSRTSSAERPGHYPSGNGHDLRKPE